MTREEAIELKAAVGRLMYSDNKDVRDYNVLIDFIDAALRPISREQVEKVWRGEWEHPHWSNDVSCADCKQCGKEACHKLYRGVQNYYNFCPHCGAPMTDDAVDMIMDLLEEGRDNGTHIEPKLL